MHTCTLQTTYSQCVVPEISTPTTREVIGNLEGGGGDQKPNVLKGKYEAKLEFPEGWEGALSQKKPSMAGGEGGVLLTLWHKQHLTCLTMPPGPEITSMQNKKPLFLRETLQN